MEIENQNPPILISIIIPSYNRAEIVAKIAINSVLSQSYKNWELLVIDDGSTDNTEVVVKNIIKEDKRVRYFFQKNKGQGAARNYGIKMAKGEYVLLLDSDDALLPEMLSAFSRKLINYNAMACRRWVFNYKKGIFDVNIANPSCVIFKKNLFEKFGYFDENSKIRGIQDADLFISWEINKKLKKEKIKSLEICDPLVIYLEHENQETNHADLEKLKKKTNAIIEKYRHNKNVPKGELSLKYTETGNFDILLKNVRSGRLNLLQSLKIRFNFQAIVLLLVSLLGTKIYHLFVYNFKSFREKRLWKIRLEKAIKDFPHLYEQAKKITSTYKNW